MQAPFSQVDIGLLKKYDTPGPRYTSYPTAPLFSTSFTAEDYRQEILDTNTDDVTSDISLYFHFPFCDTLCYFCGCTMMVTRDRNRIAEYLRYLKKEIDMIAPLLGRNRKVTQIHWGGGTPTHLSPEELLDIGEYIKAKFNVDPEVEMSVEIDPRELTQKHLGTLRHIGFNRMSMGVQDFDERVQKAVNRIQPEELSLQVLKWAEALDFHSINLDLIYGLPFQTVESFEKTVKKVLHFSPDRIAVFNYAHVPWMKKHQQLIHPEDLPTPEQKLDILKMTIELLASHGYEYIGMDHFAKPTDELSVAQKEKTLYRNFQGYSTKSGADLYGFGMSSISHFQNIYAQNEKTLQEYYKAIDSGRLATHVGYKMTEDDHVRKYVIMRLMCDLELTIPAVEEKFGIDFNEYFGSSISQLGRFVDDGLVEISSDKITIVGAGRLLLRNIAMCFDAYIDAIGKTKPVFSRTV
ncbi:MAG: oxygen-independent coproporphyrinogen III oxidase [Bacteroidetes bacterium]|nr:oxygen-independent coproporphyrinogen III oxidase [Bacteroidota bacterium]MCW5895503.1 oxygen-independent coproporphyrinogen III oxidase [Bacteroidota bacterium]